MAWGESTRRCGRPTGESGPPGQLWRSRHGAGRLLPGAAKALSEELGLENVACHIGMAVDPEEFAAVSPRTRKRVRKELGLGEDKFILAPSRMSPQKGADLLVQAAGPLLEDGWRLAIIGPVNDAPFYAQVRNLAEPFKKRIHLGQLARENSWHCCKSRTLWSCPRVERRWGESCSRACTPDRR